MLGDIIADSRATSLGICSGLAVCTVMNSLLAGNPGARGSEKVVVAVKPRVGKTP
jgi:hypothetical protein